MEVVFVKNPPIAGTSEHLSVQLLGVFAEFERYKIKERFHRGRVFAARNGKVSVISHAPYGYHYVTKHLGGGEASFQIRPEQAEVVKQIFKWVGQERCTLGEVCRRLQSRDIPTHKGKSLWNRSVISELIANTTYMGKVAWGKTRVVESESPLIDMWRRDSKQPKSRNPKVDVPEEEWIFIDVPPIVSADLFELAQAQLKINKSRQREQMHGNKYLLQGMIECGCCGYTFHGKGPNAAKCVKSNIDISKRTFHTFYHCPGTDTSRFGGEKKCENKQVRMSEFDDAVWQDVRDLLSDPQRVRKEYERLLGNGGKTREELEQLKKMLNKAENKIKLLLDLYTDQTITEAEFRVQLKEARNRQENLKKQIDECQAKAGEADLRLALSQFEDFSRQMSEKLETKDMLVRREIVRSLVSKIVLRQGEAQIVYRKEVFPFDTRPQPLEKHCWGRAKVTVGGSRMPPTLA